MKDGEYNMKIQTNALQKLVYYFQQIKWYTNCKEATPQMTEEILEELFRTLGIAEPASITLFTFKENTLAVKAFDEGFTFIDMEVFAPEYDDFVKFSYHYTADPIKMIESVDCKIDFDGLRIFRKFSYDFSAKKWNLSNI